MLRIFGLAVAFASVALSALADTRCSEPYAPEIHISASTTKQELVNMRDDTQAFIAASDLYQACLLKSADKNPQLANQVKKLVAINQSEKKRVGTAYNQGLGAYGASQRKNIKTSDAGAPEPIAQ